MIDAIRRLLAGDDPAPAPTRAGAPAAPRAHGEQELRVATCALLLEVAHADDRFTAEERERVEQVLVDRFGLETTEVRLLIEQAEAERREAVDLHRFTTVVTRHFGDAERLRLAEMLWRVVDADGRLALDEDVLLQRLARLLALAPGVLAAARRRAAG
jgi:uncharacterized tellurite resistance protein B-like protein